MIRGLGTMELVGGVTRERLRVEVLLYEETILQRESKGGNSC